MGLFDNYTGDILDGFRQPTWQVSTPPPLWTIQACPVCQGRGAVAAGFYGPSADLSSESCRTCDGSGLLRVGGLDGRTVERVTLAAKP